MENSKIECPIWEKLTLSFEEAAEYSGIGENKLRLIADKNSDMTIRIGSRTRVKRAELEKFVANSNDI